MKKAILISVLLICIFLFLYNIYDNTRKDLI